MIFFFFNGFNFSKIIWTCKSRTKIDIKLRINWCGLDWNKNY